MNRLPLVGLMALLACSAQAGGNPDVRTYIDFDPPNYVHAVTPEPYETIEAYVCIDQLGTGMIAMSFAMTDLEAEYPGFCVPPSFTRLLPGDLVIGCWPWESPGSTCVSTECMTPEYEPVLIGVVTIFYLGGSACLEIRDHGEYPRWIIDCSDPWEVDEYCVLAHGSIGGALCPEGDCPSVPVESATWGAIRSIYR